MRWAPPILQRRGTDEYVAPVYTARDQRALAHFAQFAPADAGRLQLSLPGYAAARVGTAATLRAIDAAAGGGYYDVPAQATRDGDAAREALGGNELVIDVQTHYVADQRTQLAGSDGVLGFIKDVAPERFRGLDRDRSLSLAEFLRCVYVESETAVAVLTAAPGGDSINILSNDEIAGTQELLDRTAGSGRMLHHAIVHPDDPRELERLEEIVTRCRPCGFKVYTLFGSPGAAGAQAGWMLDDEEVGLPFLERARALGIKRICTHKGLSSLAPTGSPRDIGPAARAFPELDFLVYHSGYELARNGSEEGPYIPVNGGSGAVAMKADDVLAGTDRLVASLEQAGIKPGANVYAELGSTWYVLMRRPREAAHVLGKLLVAVGEDNVLWGTDSVWYGPCQPLIDAFRAFRIPDELCERHGYPQLTPAIKAKILGLNASRVYGIDAGAAQRVAANDDLAWVREALDEARRRGELKPS